MAWPNPVAAENACPDTGQWRLDRPATGREIEGYASATSVNRGEVIHLLVNTTAPSFELEVFRIGWYQGLGAWRVFGPVTVPGTWQVMPEMDPATGLVDCAWVNPFELTTATPGEPAGWVSGVHLARLTASDSAAQSYIIFVLRDGQRGADLLAQLSVTTYQAYNSWGGKRSTSGAARSASVRPRCRSTGRTRPTRRTRRPRSAWARASSSPTCSRTPTATA